MLTLYSKNNCQQCRQVKRWLDNNKIDYTIINIDEQPEYIATLKEKGLTTVPVLDTGDKLIKGFAISELNALKKG